MLGDAPVSTFTKQVFMNLADFAEKKLAKQMVFVLDKSNNDRRAFRKMFRVIDASRIKRRDECADLNKEASKGFAFFHMML